MNIALKKAVTAALTAGAALASVGAHALGTVSSGSSDLVLWIDDHNNTAGTDRFYALDTGFSLNTLLPTGSLVSNAVLNTTISGVTATIAASPTLQTFLGGDGASDTVTWAVEGGQFFNSLGTGATSTATKGAGKAKVVFSSVLGTTGPSAVIAPLQLGSMDTYLNGMNNLTGGNSALSGILGASGTETTAATWSSGDQAKFGVLGNATLADTQSPSATPTTGVLQLFGLTGNGNTSTLQSYELGTVSFTTNGTLTLTANAPVPLPAAVWLLGSGLLGLFGVSRRRLAV